MSQSHCGLRALLATGTLLVIGGGVAMGFTVSATVASGAAALTVKPSTGLSSAQKVTVTGAGLPAALNGQLVAVVECGNADSAGMALPGTQPAQSDCSGAESLGTQTLLVKVANGTASTPYTVQMQNIGANHRQCIAHANFACMIAMADVNTQGKALQISAPITFSASSPPPTTTTTMGNGSKSSGQTVGVVVSQSATTTTTTPPTTTTTSPASSTTSPSSSTGTSAAPTTTAPSASSAAPKGTLAFTGVDPALLWAAVVGLVLLDLGYLGLSVRRRPRWARQLLAVKASGVAGERETRQ